MRKLFKNWCQENNLFLSEIENCIYKLNDKIYLLLELKDEVIIDKKFSLILNEEEKTKLKKIDFIIFFWGKKFYYTPKEKIKDPEFNIFLYISSEQNEKSYIPFLGIHGKYELLNGSRNYEDWCQKGKFLGCSSLGICEKNTLAGTLNFQQVCKDNSIDSIIGETITIKKEKGELVLGKCFAINQKGWENLLQINSYINVFSVGQWIDEKDLFRFSEGLIFIFNPVYSDFNINVINEYKTYFLKCYFQLDSTIYVNNESDKKFLINTENYLKSKIINPILLSDAYYLESFDSEIKQTLNTIAGKRDLLVSNSHFKSIKEEYNHFKNLFGDSSLFEDIFSKSIESLIEVEDLCKSFKIETGRFKLPKYKMTEEEFQKYETNEDLFYDLIDKNFPIKVPVGKEKEFSERLIHELSVIQRGGFIDYFLILWDIVRWCKENDILTGIGRGSAGGSLVAYILEITRIDPIEYNLLFERFLNEGRLGKSLPDIDVDFESIRRDDVKKYLESKYGEDKVCSIGTYTTLLLKAALKDISRIKGLEVSLVQKISNSIEDPKGDWSSIFKLATEDSFLKSFIDENPEIFSLIELCYGQPRSASIHPCATLILPENESIYTSIPVRKGEINGEKILVSEWEGEFIEKAGYLKEDILGINQLDKFRMIINLVEKYYNEEIDIYKIPLKEREVFKMFQNGHNGDVFQFGTKNLSSYIQQVRPENIEDLISINALYRPGPMDNGTHNDFVLLRHGEKEPSYYPNTEEITKETYSLIIYQEQIMQICQKIAGFNLVEADDIRKAMGKKNQKELDSYENRFFKGIEKNNYNIEIAKTIWKEMVSFGGYAFNRSHAAVYAITGYICQYLKYKYPLPYWITALEFALDKNIPRFLSEINNSSEITVAPPDINKSQLKFSADFTKNQIIWSISKVKQCGEISVDLIFQERQENGPFFSIEEFLSRVDKSKINKSVVENLIISGAFDELEKINYPVERKDLIKKYREIMNTKVDKSKDWFELNKDQSFFYEDWWWSIKQKQVSGLGFIDYKNLISNLSDFNLKKYLDVSEINNITNANEIRKKVITGGFIEIIEEKQSVKGPWMKILIEQNYENIWLYLWSDLYLKFSNKIKGNEGNILIFNGRVVFEDRKNENIIQAEEDFEIKIVKI